MPRQARIDAPGALHHIITRGIERGKIFRDDKDREEFLTRLGQVVQQTKTKCYAWALIPNHFHLLLKTGDVPMATVMRRVLTGYAVWYNHRHHRSGHLFQNRYKSILCQEDVYLKELVRYIHLNPLRAGLVKDLKELDRYPYTGHKVLMGKGKREWQSIEPVLHFFSENIPKGRQEYQRYVREGVNQGRQPNLVGGGLIRSAGGWTEVRMLRKGGEFQKSDERILGDGDFVERVLAEADEQMAKKYAMKARGIGLDQLAKGVAALIEVSSEELIGASKNRKLAKGRSLFCYWAAHLLGFSMIEISKRLEISLSTVSVSAQKGKKLVHEKGWAIEKILNINI
ncbi:MAG: transposase [Thermodesulfobacteriota bacterium]